MIASLLTFRHTTKDKTVLGISRPEFLIPHLSLIEDLNVFIEKAPTKLRVRYEKKVYDDE